MNSSTKNIDIGLRFKKAVAMKPMLMTMIQRGAPIDFAKITRDPVMAGAFAELTNDCMIAPVGDMNLATGLWQFRIVHNEAERETMKANRRAVHRAEMAESKTATAAAEKAKEREQ